ncbi:hypothetical protein [Halosimplex salinum]|uniref:hypothetical protein n=1 Tax=Halosimplex salinum TaxID=1710538 RepID=UPI0013DDF447|nr:hypothetical protein [Halosimplex salinum]
MVVREGPSPLEVEKTTDVFLTYIQIAITLLAGMASILSGIISQIPETLLNYWAIPVALWSLALVVFLIGMLGRWQSKLIHKHLYEFLRGGPNP